MLAFAASLPEGENIENGADAEIMQGLALADAVARDGEKETGANVVVYSDTFRSSQATVRGSAFSLSVINCGKGEKNRAVYSLEASDGQAFARVANFGADCSVSLTCEADGAAVALQMQEDGFLRMTLTVDGEDLVWYLLPADMAV